LDVADSKDPPPEDKTSTEYYLWLTEPPLVREREEALSWLGESFLWGGVTILILSAAVTITLPEAGSPVLAVALYFLLGVALLSQARFSVSHSGWLAQGITVQPGISRRWLLWVLIFLLIVVAVALLLPTNYALGPVLAVYTLLLMIFDVVMLVISFLVYLVVLLLALLFPGVETPTPPALGMPTPVPPDEALAAGAGSSIPWLQVVMSIVFWLTILSIVGYALLRFLQDRWNILEEGEAAGTWWARLLTWLRGLWQRWWDWQGGVGVEWARRRLERPGRGSLSARLPRFFSLRRLSPRDLVRYFYLSAERRAGDAGQPRGPGQTPYEYRASLDGRFPELEPDLEGLTEAFVRARYSRRPVEEEDAEAVKPLWQRIKAALRRKRFEGSS
jgi:hypothetical protein